MLQQLQRHQSHIVETLAEIMLSLLLYYKWSLLWNTIVSEMQHHWIDFNTLLLSVVGVLPTICAHPPRS